MNSRPKAPTWDSLVALIICAAIAVIGIAVGTAWLGKPEFVSEPVAHNTASEVEPGADDVPENLPCETSGTDTETQPEEASTTDAAVSPDEKAEKRYVIVTVKSAVVRSSNSAESDMVAYVSKGKKLEVIDKKGKWYSIIYMGKTCWIHQKCVEPCEE